MPLVSICLPTLNARKFLEPRMESILAQTLTDWELIVCDSFSDDGTWEYFQQFKIDPRVRLYQVAKEGLYAGWNECLRRATGEYVYIATADDTCKPELLEVMVGALERTRNAEQGTRQETREKEVGSLLHGTTQDVASYALCSHGVERGDGSSSASSSETGENQRLPVDIAVCNFDFIDELGHVIDPPPRGTARTFYGEWLTKSHLRSGELELIVHLCLDISWTTITSVVFRRSILEKTGLFSTAFAAFGDRFWAIRSACHSDTVFVPGRLATWRYHAGQKSREASAGLGRCILKETMNVVEECGSLISARWKKDPSWESKLLWGVRRSYLASYCLDRHTIRRATLAFLAGCAGAAIREPRFLFHRILTGFSWQSHELMEPEDYVRRLIREWNVHGLRLCSSAEDAGSPVCGEDE